MEGDVRDFRGLEVWQKAHELTLHAYRATDRFPRAEQFGLTAQIRRSSAGIPTNIAEGCGRSSQPEFAHFLHVALGSASELEYQLFLSAELGFLNQETHERMQSEVVGVKQMLTRLAGVVRKADAGSSVRRRGGR